MNLHEKYLFNAKLIRVIDGDTVDAWIDLGFGISIKRRVRLWGINTPETRTKDLVEKAEGIKSKIRLMDLLDQNKGSFALRSVGVDKYGRCLGEIYIQEININKQLLAEGFAETYKS